jgi:hypothetical protein
VSLDRAVGSLAILQAGCAHGLHPRRVILPLDLALGPPWHAGEPDGRAQRDAAPGRRLLPLGRRLSRVGMSAIGQCGCHRAVAIPTLLGRVRWSFRQATALQPCQGCMRSRHRSSPPMPAQMVIPQATTQPNQTRLTRTHQPDLPDPNWTGRPEDWRSSPNSGHRTAPDPTIATRTHGPLAPNPLVVGRLHEECFGLGTPRLARDEPVNLSDSRPETHQHCSPADVTCCYSLLLDPDATIGIDLHKRLFLLVTRRGE